MTAQITPPWQTGKVTAERPSASAKRPAGNPNWYPGMKSPNPAGRPKGTSARTKLVERMLEDADGVVDAVVRKALDGDVGAAALILGRIAPAIKAQMERVEFALDPDASTSGQLAQVLAAVADGVLAPDAGRHIIESVKAVADVRAAEELESRIEALEARHVRL
ncbi:MAG: DUF5681 domain-containing protein [Pseudomonadota bacterium]